MTNKVFCIGLNKTGTSSLHRLFGEIGRRAYHGTDWHEWSQADKRWQRYDAFSDGWPAHFERLLRRYPQAQFILNTRRLDDWVLSRFHHVGRNQRAAKNSAAASKWLDNSDDAVGRWIAFRRTHHAQVLRVFTGQRRKQLLIVDFCDDIDAHRKVARFLGVPLLQRQRLAKPHANHKRNNRPSARDQALLDRIGKQVKLSERDWRSLDV